MKKKIYKPNDKILFGQFLIEKKKIDREILSRALEVQSHESDKILKKSHRFLGQILFEDFKVFKNRLELNKYIQRFHDYKDEYERMFFELENITNKKA